MAILQNKVIILVVGGILVAGIVWYSFLRDDNTALLETQDLTESSAVDSDIVNTLLELRSVSLSGTILSDPAFQALRDFSTPITPEPVGRPNPFAPLNMRTAAAPTPSFAASTTPRTSTSTTPASQR